MRTRHLRLVIFGLTILLSGLSGASAHTTRPPVPDGDALAAPAGQTSATTPPFRSSPVMFIENVGQFDDRARFLVWGGGPGTVWLAEDAIWITVVEKTPPPAPPRHGEESGPLPQPLSASERGAIAPPSLVGKGAGGLGRRGVNVKLTFPGANPHPRLEPFDRLDTVVSHFIGNDPARWRPDVPVWGGVRYVDLYPGVDLEITSETGRWTWRLACRANCQFAPPNVRLRVEGAHAVELLPSPPWPPNVEGNGGRRGAGGEGLIPSPSQGEGWGGGLRLTTAVGEFTLPLSTVEGWPIERLNVERVNAQTFDITAPLTFAPPSPGYLVQTADASDLTYATFLGGGNWDYGSGIAVDGSGATYVTGWTASLDFPTTPGAFDTSKTGYSDAFVAKLNAAGTALLYATFLGGGGDWEFGYGIAVDGSGAAYITGDTDSADFPTTGGAFDTSFNGGNRDAFVVKVNANGTGLAYATFLGGSRWDYGYGIALDGSGAAYVTGYTESADFPTTPGAFDTGCGTDGSCNWDGYLYPDAFVARLNPSGSSLAYATFLGGSDYDEGEGIAVDGSGTAYVTGWTGSADFPSTSGAFDTTCGTDGNCNFDGTYLYYDAFVVKLNAAGAALEYATFLGGGAYEQGHDIAVNGGGAAYITGWTGSPNFPTTAGAFDTGHNGSNDAFIVKLNGAGAALEYGTFLGGHHTEWGTDIAVDGDGAAYVTGWTWSADFPTTPRAFDTTYAGGSCGDIPCSDAFVVKLNAAGTGLQYATFLGGGDDDSGEGIAVDGRGAAYVTGVTHSPDFPTTAGAFDISFDGLTSDAFAMKLVVNNPMPTLTTLNPSSAPAGSPAFTLTAIGTNFVNASVVRWNGADRATTFVSSTQLRAGITAADIATPGTASVTVFNPPPGGGESNALPFTINPATGRDPYEPDDTCATANAIVPDGSPQTHNIHTPGDADWVRFNAIADTYYVVSALHIGDDAHPILRLYDRCDADPIRDPGDTFGFDQIITFRAERSGLYYLKFTHLDPNAYGDDTGYQVSVRPGTIGAAIIVGGRLYPDEELQPQITFMTNRAYQVFRQAGYDDATIYYLSADPNPPPGMDAPSLPGNLAYALQSWAANHVQDGDPMYLYLTDHGEREFFFLDAGQKVTPNELDTWLLSFQNQRPHSPLVVIIEACRSGSFITPSGSISRPGRVIVTATGENNDAYVKPAGQGGAYFSDAFFDSLAQNYDLWQSYRMARETVRDMPRIGHQTPWIDGNGNGMPYPLDTADEGAGRNLGLGRVAALSGGQAPFIEPPMLPQAVNEAEGLIQVRVLDENPEGTWVWMEVTKPSTPPPSAPPGYITPVSHAEWVTLVYNPATGRFEVAFAFDEVGEYQFVFYAEDGGGQHAQAVSVRVVRDVNGDGVVNVVDVQAAARCWGQSPTVAECRGADIDNAGAVIDVADIMRVVDGWVRAR